MENVVNNPIHVQLYAVIASDYYD